MVRETHQQLQNFVRDFDAVKEAADKFVNWANSRFKSEDAEVEVMDALPEKHLKKKKAMLGEYAEELATTDALVDYRIKVHNIILDTATTCMHRRFLQHGELYADLACLDPLNFHL